RQREPERERSHEIERPEDRAADEAQGHEVNDREHARLVEEAGHAPWSEREHPERERETDAREDQVRQRQPPRRQERRVLLAQCRSGRAARSMRSMNRYRPKAAANSSACASAAGRAASSEPAKKRSSVAVNSHICTISSTAISAIAPSI